MRLKQVIRTMHDANSIFASEAEEESSSQRARQCSDSMTGELSIDSARFTVSGIRQKILSLHDQSVSVRSRPDPRDA